MSELTEIKMDNLLEMESAFGLWLYGLLKIKNNWIFDTKTIITMFNIDNNDLIDKMRIILDIATQDINKHTDLKIKYTVHEQIVKFDRIEQTKSS